MSGLYSAYAGSLRTESSVTNYLFWRTFERQTEYLAQVRPWELRVTLMQAKMEMCGLGLKRNVFCVYKHSNFYLTNSWSREYSRLGFGSD
jgi:hypothetical protein